MRKHKLNKKCNITIYIYIYIYIFFQSVSEKEGFEEREGEKMEECVSKKTHITNRGLNFDVFRRKVISGETTDIHGNRMSMYIPETDTFFSCLSYSRYGTPNKRGKIRQRLLRAVIYIVTNRKCENVTQWLNTTLMNDITVSNECNSNPAIESLAISLGAPKSLKDRNRWILEDLRFKKGFHTFIDKNNNTTGIWCKYALSYLFCQVYSCDIFFYGMPKNSTEVRRTTNICKKQSYKTLNDDQIFGVGSNSMMLMDKDDINDYDGIELVTPRGDNGNSFSSATLTVSSFYNNRGDSPSRCNREYSEERSSEEDSNWFAIYLLFVDTGKSKRFELCYTDAEKNLGNGRKWLSKNSAYSLRVCGYDDKNETHTNTLLREDGSFCHPPPNGRHVHTFKFDTNEIGNNDLLQVAQSKLRPRQPNKSNKTKQIYIYLYYKTRGDNGTALMVSKVTPSQYPGDPVFFAKDQVMGDADGIFVVRSGNTGRAHSYVENEMRVTVELPFREEEKNDTKNHAEDGVFI